MENMNEYMTKALEIINEWNAKDGTERYNFCRNCTLKAIREGRRLAHGDELDDAINSTYEAVAWKMLDADKLAENIKRRASKGFSDSLAGIVSRAAKSTLQRGIDQEKRDSVVISDTATNGKGEEYSLFDSVAGAADTERSAIIRATLKDFYSSLDDTDKIIFKGMTRGDTERAIAPRVGISSTATHNMSVKITQFEAENVKRIKALTLTPAPTSLTVIGDRNNQGKTSVLDAIMWALGGDRYRPSQAQRDGSVIPPRERMTLSNGIVVERSGKNSDLKVTDASGRKAGQQLLNSFVEQLALDMPRFIPQDNGSPPALPSTIVDRRKGTAIAIT